ncbi:MAG TPA: sigma-70 family RNA polymerase sigma factor [Ktedonobacteraceae bacterium]|nr:sigma-70 family RNA polymerase sigma factor [Ktedonobacteraceae bacterium]
MDKHEWLAEQFEANRSHLQAVAYRMLGSLSEAEDAVQESWFRLSRSDTNSVDNLGGWLTTVVARICLDMLRSRKALREESLEMAMPEPLPGHESGSDPEQEALLADSVGLALLVVLNTLNPAERLAFVLHDIFAVPFDEIAHVVERSPTTARQLASRARRRVRGSMKADDTDLTYQREVVDAFLTASRSGNFTDLLAVLDPNVVFRSDIRDDLTAVPLEDSREIHGADAVARQFEGRARGARPILVNGSVGLVVAPFGHLLLILDLKISRGKITEINAIGNPTRLRQLDLTVLDA